MKYHLGPYHIAFFWALKPHHLPEPVHSHSSLLFDHTLTPEEMNVKLDEAQATLEEMCQASQEDIRPQVPKLFAKLIKLMRTLDERRMTTLHRNAHGMCSKAEWVVLLDSYTLVFQITVCFSFWKKLFFKLKSFFFPLRWGVFLK